MSSRNSFYLWYLQNFKTVTKESYNKIAMKDTNRYVLGLKGHDILFTTLEEALGKIAEI